MLKVRTRGMDAIKLRIQEVHITHIKSAAPNNDFYFKGVWAKLGAFVPGGGGRFDGGAEAKGYRGPALHCHGQVVQVQKWVIMWCHGYCWIMIIFDFRCNILTYDKFRWNSVSEDEAIFKFRESFLNKVSQSRWSVIPSSATAIGKYEYT